MSDISFRNDSDHVEDLDNGRTVAPGEVFDLSENKAKQAHNRRKIEAGTFVQLGSGPTTTTREDDR